MSLQDDQVVDASLVYLEDQRYVNFSSFNWFLKAKTKGMGKKSKSSQIKS